MASVRTPEPISVTATNVGDGQTIDLSWSVTDLASVKACQVELYDRGRRRWRPYDNFHGLVTPSPTDPVGAPPRKVTVSVRGPGEYQLRVRTLAKDGTPSEWVSASCKVYVAAGHLADTGASYVLNAKGDSLRVEAAGSSSVRVLPGTAFILGVRRSLTEPVILSLPATANWQGIVAINQEGVLSVVEGRTTPPSSLRLADLTLDANGSLTLEDTRRLWAPTPLSVTASTSPPLTIAVSWTPYSELNLEGFIVYRGLAIDDLKPYAELSRVDSSYIDADVQPLVTYYYAVTAYDPARQISPPSDPVAAFAGDDVPPAPPQNLRYTWKAIDRFNITVRLEWDRNAENDMAHYEVYMQSSTTAGNFVPLGTAPHPPAGSAPFFEDSGLVNGEVRSYYVVAVDASGNRSLPSATLQVTAGDTVPPAPPTWRNPAYAAGGAWGDAWYELYWNPVTTNQDGSVCDDLLEYVLYADEGLDAQGRPILRFLRTIPADQTTLRVEGVLAGTAIAVRLVARDRLYNASAPSDLLTFQAGDTIPPAPPQNLAATLLFSDGVPKVRLRWDPPTANANGSPLTDLGGFTILRDLGIASPSTPLIQLLDPAQTTYEDAAVQRFKTYSYAVVARDKDGNVSALSNVVTLTADETAPPPAPTWTSLTTSWSGSTVTNRLGWSVSDPDGDLKETWILIDDNGVPIVVPYAPPQASYTWDHVGVENGRTYTYHLKAVDRLGNVSPAATNSIRAGDLTQPAQVTGLSAQGTGTLESPSVTLNWTAVTQTNETPPRTLGAPGVVSLGGYHVYRSFTGANYQRIATLDAATTSYTDVGLINKRTYYYKVSAFSHLGVEGPSSDPASAPAGDSTPPEPPQVTYTASFDPKAPAEAALAFTLTQPANTEPAALYRGEVAPAAGGPYTRFAEGPSPLLYKAPVGFARYYRFYALDAAGNVSGATALSITPANTTPPPDVTSVSTSYTLGADQRFTVTLTWEGYTLSDPAVFQAYRILQNQASPTLVGVVRAYLDRRFALFGLAPGTYTFAVVCDDVWGNSSTPRWVSVTLTDTTIPSAPASVSAESLPLLIAVSWPAVTTNTDGSPLLDLLHYRVQALDRLPPGETVLREWTTPDLSVAHSEPPDKGPFFYRVRAEDRHGNVSAWTYTPEPNGYRTQPVDSGSFDTTPPPPPTMGTVTVGVDEAAADGTRDFWARITWTSSSDPTVVAQRVYLGRGGSFQAVATLSDSQASYTFHNLLPDTPYQAYVTALDAAGNESAAPSPVSFTTAKDTAPTGAPVNPTIVVGKGLLGVRWGVPPDKDIAYFEAEVAEAPDKNQPTFGSYSPVYKGKAAFFIHQPLDHQKAYRYRIRSVDLTNNPSAWVEATLEGVPSQTYASPDQQGSADIAAGAILARHVQAETFEGNVIKARTLMGDRLSVGAVGAQELAAGAVRAQHLQVTLGVRNYLKNSAFHLSGRGTAPPSWQTDLAAWTLEVPPGIPVPHAQAARIPSGKAIWQDVAERSLDGKPALLSAYVRLQQGATLRLQLLDATDPSSPTLLQEQSLSTDTDWTRLAFASPYPLPTPVPSLRVRILVEGAAGGYAHVTAVKLEASERLTEWVPADGEAYSGTREVEISSDGLRVVGGRLLISTAPDPSQATSQVAVSGDGILAGDYAAGVFQRGVRIDPGGIWVSGGKFTLTTQDSPTGQTVGLRLDGTGLKAWTNGTESFFLSTDGSLTLSRAFTLRTSDNTADTRIVLDSSGLRAYRSGSERFAVNLQAAANQPLVRLVGDFEIASSGSPNTLTLSNTGIRLDTSAGTAFSLRTAPQTGEAAVELAGSFLLRRSSSPAEPQLQLKPTELTITNAAQQPAIFLGLEGAIPALRLYGDKAEFSISSQGGGVLINRSGITGAANSFSLTDTGFSIGNDAVTITKDRGIVIAGSGAGLSVGSYTDPIVRVSNTGIDILKDAGLRLSAQGTITLGDNTVAIDATGIRAPAIRSGDLTVASSNGAARIVVKDASNAEQVTITPTGVRIRGGMLEVTDASGTATISQGRIVASALQVGIAGANLIRNGRGDFGSRNWTASGGALTVTAATPEETGRKPSSSKDQVLRFETSANGAMLSQSLSGVFAAGDRISLSGWLRVAMGSGFTVRLTNVRALPDGSTPPLATPVDASWQFVRLRGICTGGTPTFEILHAGTTRSAIELTDLVVVRGEVPAESFLNHAEELANTTRYVTIDNTGITVVNGALDIRTASDSVRVDSSGISGTWGSGNSFSLTSSGLVLALKDATSPSELLLGPSPGLPGMPQAPGLHMIRRVVENGQAVAKGYVSVAADGRLVVRSLDNAYPALVMQDATGKASIQPDKIRMEDPVDGSRYVEITPSQGLVVQGGKFKLEGGSDGRLEIGFDPSTGAEGVVVKNSQNNAIETVLGRFQVDGAWYRGLYLNAGRLLIRSTEFPGSTSPTNQLNIDAGAITLTDPSTGNLCRITANGIFFSDAEAKAPPHIVGYDPALEIPPSPGYADLLLWEPIPPSRLRVLVIPRSFDTYDASSSWGPGTPQGIVFSYELVGDPATAVRVRAVRRRPGGVARAPDLIGLTTSVKTSDGRLEGYLPSASGVVISQVVEVKGVAKLYAIPGSGYPRGQVWVQYKPPGGVWTDLAYAKLDGNAFGDPYSTTATGVTAVPYGDTLMRVKYDIDDTSGAGSGGDITCSIEEFVGWQFTDAGLNATATATVLVLAH